MPMRTRRPPCCRSGATARTDRRVARQGAAMPETYTYTREAPVVADVDVLVIGGGPAGIAAVASARNGASTVLVERYGFLGGNATASLVGPFMTSLSADGKTQLIRGIFE